MLDFLLLIAGAFALFWAIYYGLSVPARAFGAIRLWLEKRDFERELKTADERWKAAMPHLSDADRARFEREAKNDA